MEDQLKNTAQRRAVQLLSKDIQYIPIQNNINNNNDNNNNNSNGRNNNNKTTTLLHQKLTALQKHYENKLRHVDNKIDAVARTTSYDISTAIELLENKNPTKHLLPNMKQDAIILHQLSNEFKEKVININLLKPLTYANDNIANFQIYINLYENVQINCSKILQYITKDQHNLLGAIGELNKMKKSIQDIIPVKTNIWELMVKRFSNDNVDPIINVETIIQTNVNSILTNYIYLSNKKPSILIRALQTLQFLYVGNHDNNNNNNYNIRQTNIIHLYIKEGIIKRFHNARKLIHAKLKEQLEFENAEDEEEEEEEEQEHNSIAKSDDDNSNNNSLPITVDANEILILQLEMLKNDLVDVYKNVTPCFPPTFDIYHLCLNIYCKEYDKLFLRTNIVENIKEFSLLNIMKLIDRLRYFKYKIYEIESLLILKNTKDTDSNNSGENITDTTSMNTSNNATTIDNNKDKLKELSLIDEVLNKLISQHKSSIRNQMDAFITNVASKLWTESSKTRLLNDDGAVYTKEPQDILFFMHHQIDVCHNAKLHSIDINRVSSVCFIQLTRYGHIQFEYLVENWHDANAVLISTMCAYINDNDKLIDNCLNFVDNLEEEMESNNNNNNNNNNMRDNEFIEKEKQESFEYVENCRDDLNVMIYKYTKDIANKIGRRIVRKIIDTYLEDGKKIFKCLYTYNWYNQEENAAEMLCEGCSDLLLDLWEWVPNKLYRSFILLGVIDEIIDIYHLHILYINVNEYNSNYTNNEGNSLNIFHSLDDYYNIETGKLPSNRNNSKKKKNNNKKSRVVSSNSNNNQKYFTCENEMLQFGMEYDLKTYVTMISKQLEHAEGPAFKSGMKSVKSYFKKLEILFYFFSQPSFIKGYDDGQDYNTSDNNNGSILDNPHVDQLIKDIKDNYRKNDGITIFKILIERSGSSSTNGFLKDPSVRKLLFEKILNCY